MTQDSKVWQRHFISRIKKLTNNNINIFYSGELVGYVCLEALWREEHEGQLFYDHRDIDTDNLIQNTLNQSNEREAWPEMQDIQTIAFEIKDNIMYMSLYDFKALSAADLVNKATKRKSGIPMHVIDMIIVHRDPGNQKLHEQYKKKQDLTWKKSNK
jgi:hypothetical protein